MNTAEKLSALRANLTRHGVDGFILPRTDEYQNEFVPACAERLAWLTGFTGSAGFAIILPEVAAVMSDGRYTIQLKQQVDTKSYETADGTKITIADYLIGEAKAGQVIGYDPRLHTSRQIESIIEKIKAKGITLHAMKNPIDEIWSDRPPEPQDKVEIFPEEYAGRSSSEKRLALAQFIKDQGSKAAIITLPDSIAWLLNVRGNDVAHNPVPLSYAILYDDARLDWFVSKEKTGSDVLRHVGNTVQVIEPDQMEARIQTLANDDQRTVMLDTQRSSKYFSDLLKLHHIGIKAEKDPCILPKAVKTFEEQEAMITAHVRDGAAVTKFLYWLSSHAQGETEITIADKLASFRKADPLYRDSSFDTICGWAGNGAIVHYRAEEKTAATVKGSGIILIDSGAQYADGTTDITRTVNIGAEPTPEMKDRNTRVLKGHIALASAKFPAGTTGAQLDSLARQALWQAGLDYAHGTGHGVGCYLSVHEEAASISPRGSEALLPGMIISNEPGYYKEGEYGIRIENLVLCTSLDKKTEDGRDILFFETITLAPIDLTLVDVRMLTPEEREWLNGYHKRVRDVLAPMLTVKENAWMHKITLLTA